MKANGSKQNLQEEGTSLINAIPEEAPVQPVTGVGHREIAKETRREIVVIKVGTSSLVTEDFIKNGNGKTKKCSLLSLPKIAAVVDVVCRLRRRGKDVILVSSGAVGAGALCLGLDNIPKAVGAKQALASVGQVHILSKYESLFAALGQPVAQVLLTYGNLGNRKEFLNAANTFTYLLESGVVPIVNENDTVATEFLRFGDNDRLSAMVSSLVNADWLFMLTDVDGLYTSNPNTDPDAKRIDYVDDMDSIEKLCSIGSAGSTFGTGGMRTKISAAQIATMAGTKTVIMHAELASDISNIVQLIPVNHGTLFCAAKEPLQGRKKWIRALKSKGTVRIDDGAVIAVAKRKSLFAAGIVECTGQFEAGERLVVVDSKDEEVAVGLVNYSSEEIAQIMGKKEKEISKILGVAEPAMDRGNMVVSIPKISDTPSGYREGDDSQHSDW